ncbi:sigma-54-dependent Fis family transcriptional regulator [Alteribacter lacisalsi]|uniref:Sigma-54-dependent Fis family transcriptional regulator n=1 Tax=Alteribacter lacisalsi TaxID=2045244 RepID=A0A2W0H2L0_9BACI|nr:sigma-54-dependent Fis family transcriptional regulator [Alteribacter lacisalsi]PYZ95437.1 sigma-54-dependent Fis family transcriptional regulator [Alteribacter lacisalsi]
MDTKRFYPAKAAMKKPAVVLKTDESIQEAAGKMYHMKDADAPVVNSSSQVVGTLSGDSLMTAMMKGLPPKTKVGEIMGRNLTTVHETEDPLHKLKWKPSSLPVVNDRQELSGILHPDEWLTFLESKWRHTEKLYQSVLDTATAGIIIVDSQQEIVYANEQAGRLFEEDNVELAGSQLEAVLQGEQFNDVLYDGADEENYSLLYLDCRLYVRKKKLSIPDDNQACYVLRFSRSGLTPVSADDESWKEKAEQMEAIIELVYDGIIIVDEHGIITMISQEYADFLEMEVDQIVGRHVTDVITHTRMHIVAQTGKAEIADIQPIKGDYMIATRLPIFKKGKLVGAVGKVLFKNLGGFKALKKRLESLEKELASYRGEWSESNRAKYHFEQLAGTSEPWKKAKDLAAKAAEAQSSVLLLGESGTGKELFAHAIHNASSRAPGPFVKVNCAAIPSDLIESELFGYVEGSFTGAKRGGKKGKFEAADGGTIFLDEIGELPIHMQVKLLRVLQEREVEKVGATTASSVDIRVIAATNRNLELMIQDGDFRLDLYYRLNVFLIQIPPLRSRPEDLDVLVPYFLKKLSAKLGKEVRHIDAAAMNALAAYNWPGNTRELENVIERTINVVNSYETISLPHLPEKITGAEAALSPAPLAEQLQKAEKKAVTDALRYAKGNKSKAARSLEISRTALYEKIARYQL